MLSRKEICARYREKHRKSINERQKIANKKYYYKNREKMVQRSKQYALENPEKITTRRKKWWKEKGKEYRLKNIEQVRKSANIYNRKESTKQKRQQRKIVDPNYKLAYLLRARVSHAIRRSYGPKSLTTIELLGCSIDDCRRYLESRFKEGMTWNSANWHIDHIIPISSFDLTNIEDQKKAFHYTNLQPLFAEENLKKSNRIMI